MNTDCQKKRKTLTFCSYSLSLSYFDPKVFLVNRIRIYNASQKYEFTLLHILRIYWTNISHLTVHLQQNISEKSPREVGSSHFFTSISNSSESLKSHCASNTWTIWTKKVPKEALRCELPTSFRVFFKNTLLYMNGQLSKISLVHTTYAWSKVDSCFCEDV